MTECDHEEADTQIMIQIEKGDDSVMVRTVDTDIVVNLIGQFNNFHEQMLTFWVAFGTGKQFHYYHINTVSWK